jgi:uncharacterized protein
MSKTKTNGRFIWHELVTSDTAAAVAFYGELFGWKASAMDMGPGGTYTIWKSGDKDVAGGVSPQQAKGIPPHWNVYFTTTDADATVTRVKELGGKVMAPAADIPNVGRFAVLVDPVGTSFSVLAPKDEREDTGKFSPGEFCWVEAHVDDPAAALAFYTKVFGWKVKEVPMAGIGTYNELLREGDKTAAGLLKKTMPSPNAWLSYIAVDDVDAAVKRAARLRGIVLAPAMDIPKIGRFAVLKDPTGAVFAVFKAA